MDQQGSLVNTHLKIFPTKDLLSFLQNLSGVNDIPQNILKVIGKEAKETSNFDPVNIQITVEDLENLKSIREAVIDKFKLNPEVIEIQKQISIEENIKQVNEEQNPKEKEKANPKLINENVNKSTDDSKPVEIKDEVKKEPFRTTSDLDWHEQEKPSEITQVEEIIQQIPFLTTPDVDWLYNYLQNQKNNDIDVPYLHELLAGANIEVPDNKVIKRNPILEARCVKLRKQQEAREYRKMTKTVDNVRLKFPEDSIAYQMKQLNRQLIAIGQFILSIFAGFLFGFRGVEWMVGNLDFGFRLLLGVMCALVIALAEIYFLAKKLNEELNIPETVQLGGPPKFVDENKYMNTVPTKKSIEKEHQD